MRLVRVQTHAQIRDQAERIDGFKVFGPQCELRDPVAGFVLVQNRALNTAQTKFLDQIQSGLESRRG